MKKLIIISLCFFTIISCNTLKYNGAKIPYGSTSVVATSNLSNDSLCSIIVNELRTFGWMLERYDMESHIITTAPRKVFLTNYYIVVNVYNNTIKAEAYWQNEIKWVQGTNTWGTRRKAFNQITEVMFSTRLPLSFDR